MLSKYFLAKLVRDKIWFVSGCVRNLGHAALERSLDPKEDIFEFFVAPLYEEDFCHLMDKLIEAKVVFWYRPTQNRFLLVN